VSQPVTPCRYRDGFGNRVHHLNLLVPYQQVRILAASVVETADRDGRPEGSTATWPLNPDGAEPQLLDFLQFRGPVCRSNRLAELRAMPAPRTGELLAAVAGRLMKHIHAHFEYARAVTHASSPVDDVLRHGKGVCQDFAHLMLALLRGYGVPARYVSGYIHRPGKESQSHAWCEAWLPDLGWLGIDPTNDRLVDDHFVKVATGRDFTDVPPNKG